MRHRAQPMTRPRERCDDACVVILRSPRASYLRAVKAAFSLFKTPHMLKCIRLKVLEESGWRTAR